jgi:hypothetical protein
MGFGVGNTKIFQNSAKRLPALGLWLALISPALPLLTHAQTSGYSGSGPSCSINDTSCIECQNDQLGLIRHSLKIRKDLTGIFPPNTVASKFMNWMKGNMNFGVYADFTLGDLMVPEFNPAQMLKDKANGTKTSIKDMGDSRRKKEYQVLDE